MTFTKKLLSGVAVILLSASISTVSFAGSDGSELSADQLFFQNGDRMSGTVLTVNQDIVSFKTAYGNVLEIPVDKIARVSQDNGTSQYKFDAETESLTLSAVEEIKAPKSDVVTTSYEEKDASMVGGVLDTLLGFETKGHIKIGGDKSQGNTDRSNIKLDAGFSGDIDDKNRVRLDADVYYSVDKGSQKENNAELALNYDHFVSEQWFVNGNLSARKDKLADLKLETIVGVSAGYQPYKSDDLNLLVTLGPSFVMREDEDGSETEALNAHWSMRYDQKIFDGPVSVFHNHDIFQSVEESKDLVLQTETGLSVPITGNFIGTMQFDYDFDNDPAAGAKNKDQKYTILLGYKW